MLSAITDQKIFDAITKLSHSLSSALICTKLVQGKSTMYICRKRGLQVCATFDPDHLWRPTIEDSSHNAKTCCAGIFVVANFSKCFQLAAAPWISFGPAS